MYKNTHTYICICVASYILYIYVCCFMFGETQQRGRCGVWRGDKGINLFRQPLIKTQAWQGDPITVWRYQEVSS